MSEPNWPEVLTRYSDKHYQPKANQGYPTRQALAIRADGKDMDVPKGAVLRFDHPGVVSVMGKVAGGTDYEIQLSSITLVEGT